jgi:thiaminase (transcriptional activator TenA)
MSTPSFYSRCLDRCGPIWEQALSHSFVQGLAKGTLSSSQIRCYLIQDGIYLTGYVQVCRVLAERATTDADRTLFEDSARLSEEAEVDMQAHLSKALGISSLVGSPLPATEAYMKQEAAAVQDVSQLVALAGATPCNVLYAEVGQRLQSNPDVARPDHPFRLWLDLYADESVQAFADRWKDVLDRWAGDASADEQERAREAFSASMQCEIDFWEQAWCADSNR